MLGKGSVVGQGTEFPLHSEFWEAHTKCGHRFQHRLARRCGERQGKGFLPGLGSPGRKDVGGTRSHTEGTLVTAAVSRCPTPHPAQHPAGTGAAPTAPNFRTSITALT